MTRTLAFILSTTMAAACAAQEPTLVEYSANVSNPEPVEIGPGVEVIANTREPVFRTANAYWLNRDGHWFRNDELSGKWVRIATPPPALATIGEPRQYANTRPDTRTVQQRDLRTMREPEPQTPRAPYPRPPQQEAPLLPDDDIDRVPVPTDPGLPPPRQPDQLTRPTGMQ